MNRIPVFTTMRSQVVTLAGCWLLLALFLGELGILHRLPRATVPTSALLLCAVLTICFLQENRFRRWLLGLDTRLLVAVHLLRLPAGGLVLLRVPAELSGEVGLAGGWANLLVGMGALLLLGRGVPSSGSLFYLWNFSGIIQLFWMIGSAAHLAESYPGEFEAFTSLPLSLLPTFLVPILLLSHWPMVLSSHLRAPGETPHSTRI